MYLVLGLRVCCCLSCLGLANAAADTCKAKGSCNSGTAGACDLVAYPLGELNAALETHPPKSVKRPLRLGKKKSAGSVYVRYAIRNGTLYRLPAKDKSTTKETKKLELIMLAALQQAAKGEQTKIPDVDLYARTEDCCVAEDCLDDHLCFCSGSAMYKFKKGELSMPNPYFLCAMAKAQLKKEQRAFETMQNKWPWEKRKPLAFFRGNLGIEHGDGDEMDGYIVPLDSHPRGKLVNAVGNLTNLFDVGITGFDGLVVEDEAAHLPGGKPEWEKYNWARKQWVDFQKYFPRFKYLLNIDGKGAAWRGFQLLRSGSVTLWPVPAVFGEHFSRDLMASQHYAAIRWDYSDLVSVVQGLRADDHRARVLADSALDFSRRLLGWNSTVCYVDAAIRMAADTIGYELDSIEKLQAKAAKSGGKWARVHPPKNHLRSLLKECTSIRDTWKPPRIVNSKRTKRKRERKGSKTNRKFKKEKE